MLPSREIFPPVEPGINIFKPSLTTIQNLVKVYNFKCYLNVILLFICKISLKTFFRKFGQFPRPRLSISKTFLTKYLEKYFLLQFCIKQIGIVKAVPIRITKTTLHLKIDNTHINIPNKFQLTALKFKCYLLLTAACLLLLQCIHLSRKLAGNTKHTSELLLGWLSWLGLHATGTYIYLFKNKGH